MEKDALSKVWIPDYPWCANQRAILDEVFEDFDAQAERLSGHDQDYVQLSNGPFRGRFVSCFLGDHISLHIEQANQMLQQTVVGAQDAYSIGVVLSEDKTFRVSGQAIGKNDIFVVPPRATLHLRSPEHAAIMAVVIAVDIFEQKLAAAPQIVDWLCGLHGQTGCVHAPRLAERMRTDTYSALATSAQGDRLDPDHATLGGILMNSLASGLMLDWGHAIHLMGPTMSRSFSRFLAVDHHARQTQSEALHISALSQDLGLSSRSIQYACAQESLLGFGAYQRVLRLHAVRRSLGKPINAGRTIGDIAAEYGFLNWSHFGEQYLQHFGERPSETRQRAN